jgi:hypothetical protein
MQFKHGPWNLLVAFWLASACQLPGATATREETRGEDRFLVLENDHARVVVFPAAGAAIIEYVDKRIGTNLVAGVAVKGSAGYAWKDVTRLHPNDPPQEWMGTKSYSARFKKGDGFEAIVATCEAGWLRVEREMRLANESAELTVLIRHTNISRESQGTWLRWHPYMTLDDPFAESSFFALPGPGPDQMRKFAVGVGYDSNQLDVPGYWLAMNQKSGLGMWMTFRKEQVVDCSTWTDYNFKKHPRRGWFTAELYPKPISLKPGESTELHCTYFPFHADEDAAKMPMGFVAEADRAGAIRFLSLVRANATAVNGHSMVPESNDHARAIQECRFYFSHKRRDRFALQDWGIADAMLAVSATQANAAWIRQYAHAFESQKKPVKLRYEFNVADNLGKSVLHKEWDRTLDPSRARVLDQREDVPIQQLPDGWYTFTIDVFADGDKKPIHHYFERRKLNGQRRDAMAAARRAADAKPLIERERPFVAALRKVDLPKGDALRVPIGVEEAGGIARRNWPVRTGVPFARGRLKRETAIRVTAPDGKEVPTQTKLMGTWMDGSVKWLLVDFLADVPAYGHAFYRLEAVPGKTAASAPIATQQGDRFRVDTGIMKREFTTAKGGKILGLFSADDLWWETGDGKRYEFQLAGDGAGVIIEENGPLRAVVKATGWYYAAGSAAPIAMGELRAEFLRGQKFSRLFHTVTYAGDPWRDTLGGYGIRFRMSDRPAKQVSVELDGKVLSQRDRLDLQQVDEDLAIVRHAKDTIATGRRATGAASLTTDDGDIVVNHRDLWRLHPKKIEADAATASLTFHYWPKDAGAMDWRPREDSWLPSSGSIHTLAVGVSRTHEFVIAENAEPDLAKAARLFDEPVLAVVPPRYLCATDALLHLQPYDPERVPALEQIISETLDSYLLQQELHGWYGEWKYGSLPNTYLKPENRWADFGRYAHILNEQDICHTPWLAFLRSGDRKYFKFAEANTRHLLEVGTIRLEPVFPQTAGLSHRHHECIWVGAGDYGHSMLDPFLELYHATGFLPAWEAAVRMARGMAEQRDGAWRYISNPIAGLSRMYLETQEPFYKEQADRIWTQLCAPDRNDWWKMDHGNRMALYYSQINEDCKRLWCEWTDGKKDRFTGLDVLAAQYQRTGDLKYARAVLDTFLQYQKDQQGYDPQRTDPLRWSIGHTTQFILVHTREMMYASQAIADAQARDSKQNP